MIDHLTQGPRLALRRGARRRGAWSGAALSRRRERRLGLETLETRRLLSVTWIPQGPGPIVDGQSAADPDDQVVGTVEALAVDPDDPNVVYAGTVAGGIWKTTNFLAEYPHWTPLTDQAASLAIGALALSPLDPTHQRDVAHRIGG